jgi:hypothetical protein
MNLDAIRRVHDAAVALGAECDSSSCVFNDVGAIDQVKSYTRVRARTLMFLHELGREISPG